MASDGVTAACCRIAPNDHYSSGDTLLAVRIRMKRLGRRHRPFYRICAVDSRRPRDGRVLEELGTYDPMVKETDARAVLNGERIDYWLDVGAQPSDKVKVLIKKYGSSGTHLELQKQALERLQPKPKPVVQPSAASTTDSEDDASSGDEAGTGEAADLEESTQAE